MTSVAQNMFVLEVCNRQHTHTLTYIIHNGIHNSPNEDHEVVV